jgi:serine phosphatase RsbU (regulator of sigma subunit)
VVWDAFPATVGTEFEDNYRRAVETGEQVTFQAFYPQPLNAWYEQRVVPGPDGLAIYFADISVRMRALELAERAARTDGLLARVASELTQTLSAPTAAARLAEVVVPTIADWCVISVIDDDLPGRPWERLRDVGWAHAEPGPAAALARSAGVMSRSFHDIPELARVLETGRPLFLPDAATDLIAGVLQPGETLDLLRLLAPQAVEFVPLVAGDRVLGTLVTGHARPSPEASRRSDRDLLMQVADRAAIALDNARLFHAERRIAAGLQRSLLTEPPQPDHCEIVVRYEPAAAAAQVGGDWYDAFLQADGSTVLVIGDVVGHDVKAAAAMGQLRSLLRGIAATTGDGPARVLSRLDAAMQLLQVETTATAIVARLEQTPDELDAGVSRLRWSNAGHPPPLVIQPDGSVAVLGLTSGSDDLLAGVNADVLLGLDASTPRTESEVALLRGSTVLLFTDGLVERRDQPVDAGLVRLRNVLAGVADRPLDELCDAVLATMLDAEPEDDVAIAAVRLHPQDRPRPPDAVA